MSTQIWVEATKACWSSLNVCETKQTKECLQHRQQASPRRSDQLWIPCLIAHASIEIGNGVSDQ
jgi:hypothetical protein